MSSPAKDIHNLVYQIMRTMQSNDRETCSCFGVTHLQGLVLLELAQKQSLNMQQLAQRMQLAVSTMSRVVDKLVDAALVDRREDKDDRRVVLCIVTEEGQRVAQQLQDCYTGFFNQLVAEIGPEHLTGFLKGLKIMVQQLQCNSKGCGCAG